METESFSYSYDNQRFHGEHASREEAIEEAYAERCGLAPGTMIYTGRRHAPPHPSEFLPDPDDIIDTMACRASDNYGECAEDWLSFLNDEQKAKLQPHLDAIAEMIKEIDPPTFWLIEDIEPYVVPEA